MFDAVSVTGERVQLRPFCAEDVRGVLEGCTDADTQRWLPLPNPYTVEHATKWSTSLSEELRLRGDGLHLAACTRSGTFAGCVSLKHTDWRARVTEIGYWTRPSMRGQSLMSDAVATLTDWALANGMERVGLLVSPANYASLRVAEKAGFAREGLMRNAGFTHAGRTHLLLYARSNPII